MPALNFKSRFVAPIRARTKRHTIRELRKDKKIPKVGDRYRLYCGMRTSNCFLILPDWVTLTKVEAIAIYYAAAPIVFVEGMELSGDEHEALAKADGFDNWDEMKSFWKGRNFPFFGHILHWKEN